MDQITENLKLAIQPALPTYAHRNFGLCSTRIVTTASVSFTAAMKASGAEGILIWVLGYQNISIIPSAQHLVLVLHRKSTYRL